MEAVLFWIALVPLSALADGIVLLTVYIANLFLSWLMSYAVGTRWRNNFAEYSDSTYTDLADRVDRRVGDSLYAPATRVEGDEKMRTGEIALGRLTARARRII